MLKSLGQEARYFVTPESSLNVDNGDFVKAGDLLAKLPREARKTRDIIGGLTEIVELFEARRPKEQGILASIAGEVHFAKEQKNKKRIVIKSLTDENLAMEVSVARGRNILVQEGDHVEVGDFLVDGPLAAHDILSIMGVEKFTTFMIDSVQGVYRAQGIRINDKHIEVIVRHMLRRYEVMDPGDSIFMAGDHIDIRDLTELNAVIGQLNGALVKTKCVLQGITKVSISTSSFISAASFQDTARVLTLAAILQQVDHLRGIKANMIACRLIKAGTGLSYENYVRSVREQYRDQMIEQQ